MVAMKERVRMDEEKKKKVKCRVCSCCCGIVYVQQIKVLYGTYIFSLLLFKFCFHTGVKLLNIRFGRISIGNSFNEFCICAVKVVFDIF